MTTTPKYAFLTGRESATTPRMSPSVNTLEAQVIAYQKQGYEVLQTGIVESKGNSAYDNFYAVMYKP